MTLLDGGAQHGILPVGTLAEGGNLLIRITAFVAPVVLLELCPFGGVEQVELLADVAHADIIGIVDVRLTVAALPLLRGDEDDAVGTARAVDGGGRDVLQHLHALDVVGVDGGQRVKATLDTAQARRACAGILEIDEAVDDVERLVGGVDRVAATDADMTVGTRLSAAGRHVKARHLSTQSTVEGRCLGLTEDIGLHLRHATRQLRPLLRAVTHHDDLVEFMVFLLQRHDEVLVVALHADGLLFVTHVADFQLRRERCHIDAEVALGIGCHAHMTASVVYRRTNDCLARPGVGHLTNNGGSRRSEMENNG